MAISKADKPVVEKLFGSGVGLNSVAEQTGYTWREVANYLHGRGLTGGEECWIPWGGVTKEWLLDHAHIDIRKRNKAIRIATKGEFKERGLARLYHQMCRVEGSPSPHEQRGGECEKCPKWGLCSWDYVRCESVQDWEGDSADEALNWIETNEDLYDDCYPVEEELCTST